MRVRFVVSVVIEDGIVKDLNKYEEFRGSGVPSRVSLKVRWLTEEEWDGGGALYGDEGKNIYQLRLRKVDFLNHGFTEGCVGCQQGT